MQGKVEALMVTAAINVVTNDNRPIRCRTLLDTAATSNLITEKFAIFLNLPQHRCSLSVGGLGDIQTVSSNMITATIQSRYNHFEKTLKFFTVPEITKQHPANRIERDAIQLPANIKLADPTFDVPGNIDMLIGAGPTLSTFLSGHKNISSTRGPDLFLQNTYFGWVIGGAAPLPAKPKLIQPTTSVACHVTTMQALNQLTKTWEIEEGPKLKHWTEEETACEAHFKANFRRDSEGRFVVALPFNSNQSLIGESRSRAFHRFKALENKFKRNPDFYQQYTAVIQEYMDLGFMEQDDPDASDGYFLPHHAIVKESSLTTKLRVVWDASAKSSSGVSLNDALLKGPNQQKNIFIHHIKMRLRVILIVADMEKMYCQVKIRPEDRKYLRLLWRHLGQIVVYRLCILAFGIAPAPFIAPRCVEELCTIYKTKYPIGARVLEEDTYVDDVSTGAKTVKEAIEIRDQVIALLQEGGFAIRKWASNDPQVLEGLPPESINSKLQLETDPMLTTLGMQWHTKPDLSWYTLNQLPTEATMRIILAEVAKIYDPPGLLGPLVITGRLILHDCWRHQLSWDQPLPLDIQSAWFNYAKEFNDIKEISYHRGTILPNTINIQLHGFADASEKAYGACIYIKGTASSGEVYTRLLCSRVKVAPLKAVTLARLELCAAVMLADMYHIVREEGPMPIHQAFFWSDSTIVLHWINTPSCQLKTFVANRVAEIQTKTQANCWRHIKSADNPADALSRGQSPNEFLQNPLWFSGPPWINQPESEWPESLVPAPSGDLEKKKFLCFTTCIKAESLDDSFINRFNNLTHLHLAVTRCLRWSPHSKYKEGEISVEELQEGQNRLLKWIQLAHFTREIHALKHNRPIPETSKLQRLSPILDENGILRVGGRLEYSTLPRSQQQPIILPSSHHYTTLVIKLVHERYFHPGTQTTLYTVRRKFWPLSGRNATRKVISKCIRCIRANPHTATYPMGILPKERVTQSLPFEHTGVDYCGPFYIKERKHRNRVKVKVYVAVFVCLAVKAVHLEVVSELTTEAFIAALRRFIARRGKPRSIHSDNGTNFVGANNQLKELYTQLNSEAHQDSVSKHLRDEGIEWKFIPARSPNFGGLWEAAVKSFKHHMIRVLGETLFTLEDFNTYVIEIEAILNSRPLTPNSSDPTDPSPITPYHFILGRSAIGLPDWDWNDVPSHRLSSWQHIQKLKQAFWQRWHKEYINGLNIRPKWTKGQHNIKEGTIVVIKEDNTRPLLWPIGRVIQTHPGADGITRVVTIKTANGIIERNVRKLAVLLPDTEPSKLH